MARAEKLVHEIRAQFPIYKIAEESKERSTELWAQVIYGMTEEQIQTGLAICGTKSYMPYNFTNAFKRWCYGLCDPDQAYLYATRKQHENYVTGEIHEAAYAAGVYSTTGRLKEQDEKKKFFIEYENVCQRAMSGEVFRRPNKAAIEDQSNDPMYIKAIPEPVLIRYSEDHGIKSMNQEELKEWMNKTIANSDSKWGKNASSDPKPVSSFVGVNAF